MKTTLKKQKNEKKKKKKPKQKKGLGFSIPKLYLSEEKVPRNVNAFS